MHVYTSVSSISACAGLLQFGGQLQLTAFSIDSNEKKKDICIHVAIYPSADLELEISDLIIHSCLLMDSVYTDEKGIATTETHTMAEFQCTALEGINYVYLPKQSEKNIDTKQENDGLYTLNFKALINIHHTKIPSRLTDGPSLLVPVGVGQSVLQI